MTGRGVAGLGSELQARSPRGIPPGDGSVGRPSPRPRRTTTSGDTPKSTSPSRRSSKLTRPSNSRIRADALTNCASTARSPTFLHQLVDGRPAKTAGPTFRPGPLARKVGPSHAANSAALCPARFLPPRDTTHLGGDPEPRRANASGVPAMPGPGKTPRPNSIVERLLDLPLAPPQCSISPSPPPPPPGLIRPHRAVRARPSVPGVYLWNVPRPRGWSPWNSFFLPGLGPPLRGSHSPPGAWARPPADFAPRSSGSPSGVRARPYRQKGYGERPLASCEGRINLGTVPAGVVQSWPRSQPGDLGGKRSRKPGRPIPPGTVSPSARPASRK